MSRASSLYRLQQIDAQLDDCRARLAEIETELGESSLVTEALRSMDDAQAKVQAARSALRVAEDAASSQRSKIQQAEGALYGGSIRNPKELQDLQMEVEALKRYLATLEERLLEAMLVDEDMELIEKATSARLADVETASRETRLALEAEAGSLRMMQERLAAEREAVVAGLSAADLSEYGRLRQRLKGIAVAAVYDETCGACGVFLAHSLQQQIRMGAELVRCGQCSRILYAGEGA